MIDLHCHILPGIDDGAPDLATAMAMAKMAVEDGITHIACTPHVINGVYDNDPARIGAAVERLQQELAVAGVELKLLCGADVHIAPDLLQRLQAGGVRVLGRSHYFLLEPPHHVRPPAVERFVKSLIAGGYIPVITHPERLTWIEQHYPVFEELSDSGAVMQITAGSITGRFGRRAKYWSERLLDEGRVHLVASDAHNLVDRPPVLSKAREIVRERLGDDAALDLFERFAAMIILDLPLPAAPAADGYRGVTPAPPLGQRKLPDNGS